MRRARHWRLVPTSHPTCSRSIQTDPDRTSTIIQHSVDTEHQWFRPVPPCAHNCQLPLDRHRVYRAFCPYFLAHAPKTVTEISYVGTPPEELFFEAIDWLREELLLGNKDDQCDRQ